MDKSDYNREDNDIFIVKVTGSSSKTINIPDAFCEFCNIKTGDIIKLKLIEKRGGNNPDGKTKRAKKKTS